MVKIRSLRTALVATSIATFLAAALAAAPAAAEPTIFDDRSRHGPFNSHGSTYHGTGRFDTGRLDTGRFDAGRFDAGHFDTGHRGARHARHGEFAEVIRVQPLRRSVRVATPVQQCWEEPVHYRQAGGYGRQRGRSYTAPILGGIVGGLVGNQFGGGNGQVLLTVAGAVLGASVGNDHGQRAARRQYHAPAYPVVEQRCETVQRYHEEVRTEGYLVDYRYAGRVYSAELDHHPGRRLRVDVDVRPLP